MENNRHFLRAFICIFCSVKMEGPEIFYIIIGILLILSLLVTIIVSATIIIVIIYNWRPHCRSTSNLLTVNSCITFLVFSVVTSLEIPYLFQSRESEIDDKNSTYCKILGYLFMFTCVLQVSSYLVQALSRYFITVLYKHKILLTYRANILLIIFNWTSSIIISAAFLTTPTSFQYEPESRLCILTSKVFVASYTMMMVGFTIPFMIIIFLYVLILRHTTRANRVQPNTTVRGDNKRNIKVFQNILMLLGFVMVGGSPYFLSTIINKISTIPWPLYSIAILSIAFATASQSVTIFLTNKDVKRIVLVKIGFRRAEQTQAFTITGPRNGVSNRRFVGTNLDNNI